MIKYSEIESTFLKKSLIVKEYNIEMENQEQIIDSPFIVYAVDDNSSFSADGVNVFSILNVKLVLIDELIDFSTQKKIEEVLKEISDFTKEYDYDPELRLYTTSYNFWVQDE